jgi:hypothetical protein
MLDDAFSYCLIGRWFKFEFSTDQNFVISLKQTNANVDDFLSIYEFLKNYLTFENKLNFSNSINLIVDDTFDETNIDEIKVEKNSTQKDNKEICALLEELNI